MNYFLKDINIFFFFKKKKFINDKYEQILDKLIINNFISFEYSDFYRFSNDLRLIESLCGFKFNKIILNYKNMYIKNRYLYLIVLLKFKINYVYIYSIFDYIYFYEIYINSIINNNIKFKIFNVFKNYKLYKKMIFFNLKLHYSFLSINNKKRYKKIINYDSNYFDGKLWVYLYLFFKKMYYSKIFFKFFEINKLRWLDEETQILL